MKKIVTLLAATLMVIGLAGCMDDPDGAMQRPGSSVSGQLQVKTAQNPVKNTFS